MPPQETQTEGIRKPVGFDGLLLKANCYVQIHYPWLQCRLLVWGKYQKQKALEMSRLKADILPDKGGPSTAAKVVMTDNGYCCLNVCGKEVESDMISDQDNLNERKLDGFLKKLGDSYVLCTGLPHNIFETALNGIRYEPERLEEKKFPFARWSSTKCLLWYPLRHNASKDERDDATNGSSVCTQCNITFRNLRKTNKRIFEKKTAESRKRKQAADSHSPMCFLSPQSKKQRLLNLKTEKKVNSKKLKHLSKKLDEMKVTMHAEQSDQLGEFVKEVASPQLDEVLSNIEDRDSAEAIKKTFMEDQQKSSELSFKYASLLLYCFILYCYLAFMTLYLRDRSFTIGKRGRREK